MVASVGVAGSEEDLVEDQGGRRAVMRKSYHSTAVPITLDHTIRRKLGLVRRYVQGYVVCYGHRCLQKYRRQGKQLVLSTEPISSPDGKNRSCLLLEINGAERGNCRAERQNTLTALFLCYFMRYSRVSAYNIRAFALNFCA